MIATDSRPDSDPRHEPHPVPPRTASDATAAHAFSALGHLHPMVLVADTEQRIVWSSPALDEALGAGAGCRGRDLLELLPAGASEAAHALAELHAGCLDADAPLATRLELPDHPALDVRGFPVSLPDRPETWVVCVLRPAASPAPASAPRSDPRDAPHLAALLDSAPDGVVAVDLDGFITYANGAVERLAGVDRSTFDDQPLAAFLRDPEDVARLAAQLRRGHRVDGVDFEVVRRDGRRLWLSISSQPLRLPDGRVDGGVIFLRDVTERKQVEEMLARKNAELETYVHSVSHDLRSPLVSLLGFTRLLRQDYEATLDETGRHFVDRIEQAGRTMEALIDDLLELSRIGRPGESRCWVDPKAVLLQLKAELKPRLDELGIDLQLPEAPPLVFSDRTRLYQVFSNLVGNAAKHMGPGAERRIAVSIEQRETGVRLSVQDNGRGIAPADQERIFEVFQTLGKSDSAGPSTGIGLAIVQKIAETHGGRVWVESEPGRGASFHVELPGS